MSDSINTVIAEYTADCEALQQIKVAYPYAKRFDGRLVTDDLKFEDCDIFEQRGDMPTYVRFGRRFGGVILWQSRDKPVSLLCETLLAKRMRIELARAGAEERRAWVEYIGFLVARVRDIDQDCYGGASKEYYESAKQKLVALGVPEDDLP